MSRHPNPDLSGERGWLPPDSPDIWEWRLRPGWRALVFLIPIVAVSAGLSWKAQRVARVTYQVDTVSVTDIRKALGEDAGNADLIHHLGVVLSYNNPSDIDLAEAVKYLRQAVALNPRRWDYWADLGTTCDFVGDMGCADEALERARGLNPMAPAFQWALGNHYLLTNRQEKAFPYFRRLLGLDAVYVLPTYQLCLRATRDPQAIYAEVVPQGKDASARFAFLGYLNSLADYESAMRIWGEMMAGPDRTPDLSQVKPFLDFLLDHNQIQDAGTVWSDLQRAGVIPPASNPPAANLVYDGGFERPPLNTGFDWRLSDSPDLVEDFSDPVAYQGARSLRMEFVVGRNAEYDLVNQVVRVQPNQRYQLSAYVRSQNLTSDSGPRLRVMEMGCGNCEVRSSEATLGSTAWHPLEVAFMTQPQTQAVRISFWRPRDQTGHRDITGAVWLDEVALRAMEAPAPAGKQERSR